ncbi:ovomucoid-like [Daphnia pulex]|uniref:ovomucoid-like n=1 Tax=Daphnia pulex TaxID=6669 RepID=UPI001EE13919|nr:ovomucoid-like [Daphnia pulex]
MSPIALTKNLGSDMLLVAFALCILIDINPGVEAKSFAAGAGRFPCEVGCQEIYEPLCGTDGKTYENKCTLFVENNCDDTSPNRIRKAYDGECKANAGYPDRETCIKEALKDCIGLQVIICGTDGNVYRNTCELMAKNKCDGTSVGEAPSSHCQQ